MTLAPTELVAAQEDIDAVMAAALDYIDGYIEGDAERHARAYHPECIKRRYETDEESGVAELVVLSPRVMVDYAALSEISDCETEVIIDAISEDIASVRVYSCRWVDYNQLVHLRGRIEAWNVVAPGQSGVPTSPHFADQLELYATWEYKEMVLRRVDALR